MAYDLFVTVCLSTFAVIAKLSALPLCLMPAAGLIVAVLQKRELVNWRKSVVWGRIRGIGRLGHLLVRFVLSGCWLYPADLTCWPRISWSMPHAIVVSEYD